MIKRTFLKVALLLTACLLLPLAAQARPLPSRQNDRLPPVTPAPREGQARIDDALRGQTGRLGVMIELEAAPSAQEYARAQAGGPAAQAVQVAQAQLARVEQVQQSLLAPLASAGASVLYRTQRVYNGIAARVDAGQLDAIAALPGVKAIHRLVKHSPDLESSVPLIGAPELWNGTAGPTSLTGAGMKIAIIDTGVDYLHTGFGGPGTDAAYDQNDTTVITETPSLFPTDKVIAGYDFAGDDYNGFNDPQPDPDPMDCNGHGSHVAGIAASNGVEADGSAYDGPYDPSIYTTVDFKIGPGVAPEAQIIALRVFGCDGSTELVNQAIEWAIDPNGDGDFSDRADVINMSLGSDFGYTEDPTSVAADNAVLAGTIVVASAGNDADTYYITGSPATSPRVISVASSVDATDILDGFRVNSPPSIADVYPASNSVAFDWAESEPVTATLVYPPTQRTGCETFSAANAALIAGKIVLLDWTDGECGSVTRGANAVAAGAVGAILVDNSDAFDLFITGSAVIPMVSAPKQVGDTLKTALAAGAVSVTLSAEYTSSVPFTDPNVIDTLSTFSSRGPRRNGSALKPDIAAPGQGIFSVGALTGDEGANISGTSMAAPHVAGAMALMRQLHPTWTIEELKALVMNTAVNDVRSGLDPSSDLFPPSRIGAGRIDLPRAAEAEVVAYNYGGPGTVSVSFGDVEVFGTAAMTRTIRIYNRGTSDVTYDLSYVPMTTIPGVNYTLSAASVNVPAGQVRDVQVRMTANAAQMKHTHDPTVSETQAFGSAQLSRPWLSEASGYVVLTETGQSDPSLRVPVYVTARPASDMRANVAQLAFGDDGTAEIPLTGTGVNTGANYPEDVVSLVSALELQHTDPNEASSGELNEKADIAYVGVASDVASTGAFSETMIYFGIATHDDWSTPNEVEFDIYIDTDRDGTDDFVLFNSNGGWMTGLDQNDILLTFLWDLETDDLFAEDYLNGVPPADLDTAVFNNNVIVLPVFADDLGLNAANARFNYRIVTYSLDAPGDELSAAENIEGQVDDTPTLTYDAANPGLDTTGGVAGAPIYEDLPGETIPIDYNSQAFLVSGSEGALLFHHHNRSGDRVEIIEVRATVLFLPVAIR